MQRPAAPHPAQIPLARKHAPALVADIDKDVAAAVEGAEGDALLRGRGAQFDDLLGYEDGFFELLAGEFFVIVIVVIIIISSSSSAGVGVCGCGWGWFRDYADGALFAEDLGREVHIRDAFA